MKIKSLVVGMMACAALVACSNNDLVDDNNGNQPLEGEAYVAVAITNPNNTFGRATADDEEYGDDSENKVNDATFVFFDASGNYITNVATTLTFNNNKQQSEAVLILKNATIEPKSVVAFLNVPEGLHLNQSLNALLKAAGTYGYSSNKAFTMSNSVFKKEGTAEMQIATSVDGYIQKSEAAAMEKPLPIYVERVLAKVTVKKDELQVEQTKVTLNGKQITVKPEIKGWVLSGTNKNSYILKNLAVNDITESWVWGTNRSFWAKDVNYENFANNQTEDLTFSPYIETQTTPQYCLENTLTWDAYKGTAVAYTHLLVTAQIVGEDGTSVGTICNYNGTYWKEEDLKSEFANGLKNFKKDENKAITSSDIKFVQAGDMGNKAYMAKATFKKGVNVAEGAVTALAAKGQFMMYRDGKCYFWTPIEHFGNKEQTGAIGVVRNHVYALNLTKIAGMGTPIVDPDQPIIPEKPSDDNSYLAAQVNILPWKMVSQNVDLK